LQCRCPTLVAAGLESRVGLLKDPERLKPELEEVADQERAVMHGDPEREIKGWLEKLAEAGQERRGYLRLVAKQRITDDELDEVLVEPEDTCKAAERATSSQKPPRGAGVQPQRAKDTILKSYARITPEALDNLTPEERRGVYHTLRLKVTVHPDGTLDVTRALRDCFAPENQDGGCCLRAGSGRALRNGSGSYVRQGCTSAASGSAARGPRPTRRSAGCSAPNPSVTEAVDPARPELG
jgi:hypothetical protein